MKKLLYLLLVLPLFISCSSSDDDTPKPIIKVDIQESAIDIAYGTSKELTTTGIESNKCEWVSGDKFIATVYNGKVSAEHVGSTKIYAVYEGSKDSCIVNITSINNNIYVPIIEWGISKEDLKKKETNDFQGEIYNIVSYKVNNESIYIDYYFESNKLLYSDISYNFNGITFLSVLNSASERFDYVTSDSKKYWYSKDKCFLMVREKGGNGGYQFVYAESQETINANYQ